MTGNAAEEPKGAPVLRVLARAMIRDYTVTGGPLASWSASRDVQKAIKDAVALAGLGTDPAALDYLKQELTVQLGDLTLRLTESATIIHQGIGGDAAPRL